MMRLQHGWELNLALLDPAFPDLAELKITTSWAGLILHLGFDLLICMPDLSAGSLCSHGSKAVAVIEFLNAAAESLAVSELQDLRGETHPMASISSHPLPCLASDLLLRMWAEMGLFLSKRIYR